MKDQNKSGASAFAEWLLGVAAATLAFKFMSVSSQDVEEVRKAANFSCFILLTVGALLCGRKLRVLQILGSGLISLGIFFLGVGAVLIIKIYSGR